MRPKSPIPENEETFDSDDKKMEIELSIKNSSTHPLPRMALQSTESLETEMAFSKHFTQVFDKEFDNEDIIKTNEIPSPLCSASEQSNKLLDKLEEKQGSCSN